MLYLQKLDIFNNEKFIIWWHNYLYLKIEDVRIPVIFKNFKITLQGNKIILNDIAFTKLNTLICIGFGQSKKYLNINFKFSLHTFNFNLVKICNKTYFSTLFCYFYHFK